MTAFTPTPIVPIQIRPDLTVHIQGLPHDLTKKEAEKIAGVVLAFASPRDRQYPR